MKKKTVLTKLPAGDIIEIKKLADGTFEVLQEVLFDPNVISDDNFILIEAEKLSLNDNFMKHKPCTEAEKRAKQLIADSIRNKVKNFYRPSMDPSFTYNGIEYVSGKRTAVGQTYNWWSKAAKKFDSSHNSRLGTRLEYGAFLGVLIKRLIEEGKSVEWAWDAVCNDSKDLGHYRNSENARYGFESTGSRCICGFYDLANTYKILAPDVGEEGFWLAGGSYLHVSNYDNLSNLFHSTDCSGINYRGVGWIVLS